MRSVIVSLCAGAIGSLLIMLLQLRLPTTPQAPTLMTVDLQQLLTAQVAEVAKEKLSVEQQRAAASTYAAALTASLDETARLDHAVLLVTPAVLRGAPDVTDEVRERVQKKLDAALPSPITSTPVTPP